MQDTMIETEFAESVSQQIDQLISRVREEHSGDSVETKLSDNLSQDLEKYADTWSQFIIEELRSERRIKVPNSGVIDLEKLMDNPALLFESETWNKMDERPKKDINEACTALPVNCTTSTVFISLRAVEHYLRKWYEEVEEGDLGSPTWGFCLR